MMSKTLQLCTQSNLCIYATLNYYYTVYQYYITRYCSVHYQFWKCKIQDSNERLCSNLMLMSWNKAHCTIFYSLYQKKKNTGLIDSPRRPVGSLSCRSRKPQPCGPWVRRIVFGLCGRLWEPAIVGSIGMFLWMKCCSLWLSVTRTVK